MSASSIFQAANDPDLIKRVTAMAHKEMMADPLKSESSFGKSLMQSFAVVPGPITQLMWPTAVDYEVEYETAINSGRGAPGHDPDVINDGNIAASVNAHWPFDDVVVTPPIGP